MKLKSLTLTGEQYDVRLTHVSKDLIRGEVLETHQTCRGVRQRAVKKFDLFGSVTQQDVWANILPNLSDKLVQDGSINTLCDTILSDIRRLGQPIA